MTNQELNSIINNDQLTITTSQSNLNLPPSIINELNLDLEPTDDHSLFGQYYKFYFFKNEKHVNIHIYDKTVKLGFNPSKRVEFLFTKPYLFLSLTDMPDFGHAITEIEPNHMSISPKSVFDKTKFKPREPKRANAKNSGVTLFGTIYKYGEINGILINMSGCIE